MVAPAEWMHITSTLILVQFGMSEHENSLITAPYMKTMTCRTAREYLRVSYDRSGHERSQDEQHDENTRAANERGYRLIEGYRETGSASASRYAHKTRDDFARLLADLESGTFGADVLILWESSRGSRKVGEWVTLIELCEQQQVGIFVTTHGREYDPANARDRRSLLEDAVDSEYESSKVSARIKRAAAANARAGKPHGPIPFGYQRRYDPMSRKLLTQEPHPDEAPIVRELFARLKAGHAFHKIARDFEARGIRNDSDHPFNPAHLRSIATNPAYTAIRIHDPSSRRGGRRMGTSTGTEIEGTWEPLVSRADFLAVQTILNDPKRVTTKPGKARHLLSMIGHCGVCGSVLTVSQRRGFGEYQCHTGGHVRCRQEELDEYATAAMIAYLARPDLHEAITAGEHDDSQELAQVRDALATDRAELAKLRARVAAGKLSVDSLVAAEPGMIARIEEFTDRESELITPSALRGLIAPGPDVADRWEQAPIATRRAIARIVLTPQRLGDLRVIRRPVDERHLHVPIDRRVTWHREPQP